MITSVIVKNIRAVPMISEVLIEQGSGLTSTQILINDGDEVEFTVVDDRNYNFPNAGGIFALINPQPNGVGGTLETFQIVNNNYSIARKVDGERSFVGKRFSLITPTQM